MTGLPPWFTVVLAFPDRLLSALRRSWRVLVFLSRGRSKYYGISDVPADNWSCFVRARRLNVIIQPHLRFVYVSSFSSLSVANFRYSYELMKWEEIQMQEHNKPITRELEWASIAREIALLNKPYSNR